MKSKNKINVIDNKMIKQALTDTSYEGEELQITSNALIYLKNLFEPYEGLSNKQIIDKLPEGYIKTNVSHVYKEDSVMKYLLSDLLGLTQNEVRYQNHYPRRFVRETVNITEIDIKKIIKRYGDWIIVFPNER